jgi:hypothetical protein
MTPARPLRDVFADLLGDAGAARPDPDALLAASGHAHLPAHLVAEAMVNYADTAPVEVAEHLAPYVTAHSGVPVQGPPGDSGVDDADPAGWADLLATAPAADAGTDPSGADADDLDAVVPSDHGAQVGDSGVGAAADVSGDADVTGDAGLPGDADVPGGDEWDEIDDDGNDLDGDGRADVAVIDFGGGADATGLGVDGRSGAFDDADGGLGRTGSGDWTHDLGDADGPDGVDGLGRGDGFDAAVGQALDDGAHAVSGLLDGSDVDDTGDADGDDPGDGLDG